VNSVTPLVDHGQQVQVAQAKAKPALAIIDAHPALFAQLQKYPPTAIPPALQLQAVQEVGLPGLQTVQKAAPQLATLAKYGTQVQKAAKDNPKNWQAWWWVCVAGQVLFLPFILIMTGRWSPKKAREDAEEHQRLVDTELAALSA
jgi:hypothetical protein